MALSRVQLFELIRRDRRLDPQVPVRELMRRYRVSHRAVTQALEFRWLEITTTTIKRKSSR